MLYKDKVGDFGQKIALQYLLKKNYQLLAENFFSRWGEIDLIMKTGEQIVFVEVKTRTSNKYGLPEEAIDQQKKDKLLAAGLAYIADKNLATDNYRFDCIALEIDKQTHKARIRHHKNIC